MKTTPNCRWQGDLQRTIPQPWQLLPLLSLLSFGLLGVWEDLLAQKGGFDAEGLLRRADENNNGLLEPEEISGRTRSFLQRVADAEGISLESPVPIEKLTVALKSWLQSQGRTSSGGSRDSSSGDRSSKEDSAEGSSSEDKASSDAPKVPAFGEQPELPEVPGFGKTEDSAPSSIAETRYSEEIVRRAERVLRAYDRDRSGALEQSEWGRVNWASDPNQSDVNKDGTLSRAELLARIARLQRSDDRSSSGGWSSSGETSPRLLRFAEGLIRKYDSNDNGRLERSEWERIPGRVDYGKADSNGDSVLTKEEVAEGLKQYSRSDSSRSSSSSDSKSKTRSRWGSRWSSKKSSSDRSSTRDSSSKSYRFKSPTERLPKGLPSWFARSDTDGDGQVRMHEYTSRWSSSKAAEFDKYDLNGDGIVTPQEGVKAGSTKTGR